jgi:hypothetical protein
MDLLLFRAQRQDETRRRKFGCTGEVAFGRKLAYVTKPRLEELDTRL